MKLSRLAAVAVMLILAAPASAQAANRVGAIASASIYHRYLIQNCGAGGLQSLGSTVDIWAQGRGSIGAVDYRGISSDGLLRYHMRRSINNIWEHHRVFHNTSSCYLPGSPEWNDLHANLQKPAAVYNRKAYFMVDYKNQHRWCKVRATRRTIYLLI